jgi:hypothetical protein
MAAAKVNLTVEQGATFKKSFLWKDKKGRAINLTGYSALMQVRAEQSESSAVLLQIGSDAPESGITIDAAAGKISLHITDEETALLSFKKAYYDLLLTPPSGERLRLVQGTFTVSPRVTVPA